MVYTGLVSETSHRAPVEAPEDLFGYDDDRKDRNEAAAQRAGLEPCTHCGRGVKPGKGFLVEVVDGGGAIAAPGSNPDMADPGYMGVWVLGSTCARKIPATHRQTWNGWSE